MNKIFSAIFKLLIIFAVIIFQLDCAPAKKDPKQLKVVVTILPLAEFVEQVGGDLVAVMVMVPPGSSPHAYEPLPSQMVDVSEADMLVAVGAPIEFELVWLDKLREMNRHMTVVKASEGIPLQKSLSSHAHQSEKHHHDGNLDPHIWVSPRNAIRMVKNISQALSELDPDHQELYQKNSTAYINQLDALDQEIRHQLTGKKNRKFMVYHPEWGYFASEYGLEQIPIEVEGKQPTAQGLKRFIDQAHAENIRLIIASPQFDTRSAEIISRQINGKLAIISSLDRDYLGAMKKISHILFEEME
ncbi:MAG TPA: zinc ABC transporter substrate-binding protein [bacterium]|nr:zinc ABC transporter substrate-binding protein [bacterium]